MDELNGFVAYLCLCCGNSLGTFTVTWHPSGECVITCGKCQSTRVAERFDFEPESPPLDDTSEDED